jgi:hypothetical protein
VKHKPVEDRIDSLAHFYFYSRAMDRPKLPNETQLQYHRRRAAEERAAARKADPLIADVHLRLAESHDALACDLEALAVDSDDR